MIGKSAGFCGVIWGWKTAKSSLRQSIVGDIREEIGEKTGEKSMKTIKTTKNETPANVLFTGVLAERVGFEPTDGY